MFRQALFNGFFVKFIRFALYNSESAGGALAETGA
jgi:hypothetical protein